MTTMSGESQRNTEPQIIGVTADNFYWCHECASGPVTPMPAEVEDVSMRGHTLTRCSFCGRRLVAVPG